MPSSLPKPELIAALSRKHNGPSEVLAQPELYFDLPPLEA